MWGRKDESSDPVSAEPKTQPELSPSPPKQAASPAAAPSGGASAAERGRTIAQIGKSLKLKGEISGSEDLYIDGEIEGTVELNENSLTVGPNGKVHADVAARSITIHGRLQGNVRAGERIEIRKTGSLEGDLSTSRIMIEDGAVFRGSIDIVKPGQRATNGSTEKAPPAHAPQTPGKTQAPLGAKVAEAGAKPNVSSPAKP